MNYNNYDNYEDVTYQSAVKTQAAFMTLMSKVYIWMTLALAMTGVTAYCVANSPTLLYTIFSNPMLTWGLLIGEFVLVMIMSAGINRMPFPVAGLLFVLYSILNGVTLSCILLVYTESSIATAFFVTAGTFAAMTVVGLTIKKDLGMMGRILIMALIGLIIATVVNIFVGSTFLEMIISYVGVLIFVGLTAYDTQKIKQMFLEVGGEENDATMKLALMGSLTLYLDFINLFLYILRIFGNRK